VERHDQVASLRLNRRRPQRPQRRVAQAARRRLAAEPGRRRIVITGTDPAFCAGLDLRDLGVPRRSDLPHFTAPSRHRRSRLIRTGRPTALGPRRGGFSSWRLLACDFHDPPPSGPSFADPHLRRWASTRARCTVDLPAHTAVGAPAWAHSQMSLDDATVVGTPRRRCASGSSTGRRPTPDLVPDTARTWRHRSPSSRGTWGRGMPRRTWDPHRPPSPVQKQKAGPRRSTVDVVRAARASVDSNGCGVGEPPQRTSSTGPPPARRVGGAPGDDD
jgi:hypothetical protein